MRSFNCFLYLLVLCTETLNAHGERIVKLNCIDSFFYQVDVSKKGQPNTVFIIKKNYDLNGNSVTLPEGCTLCFKGGSIRNGSISFNNTKILASGQVMRDISMSGTISNEEVNLDWFTPNAQISSLLNWVIVNNQVRSISIPEGRFFINEPVLLRSNILLSGSSNNTTLVADRSYIQNYPNKYVMLSTVKQKYAIQGHTAFQFDDVNDYNQNIHDITIKNLTFDLNYYGGDNEKGQMATVKIENARNVVIEDCQFIDRCTEINNHTYHAVYFIKSKNCRISNCYTENISFASIVGCEDIICSYNEGKNAIRTWLESNDGYRIVYNNNSVNGILSMTSALGINSRNSIASHNVVITCTPIICGIVLGHTSTEEFTNSADSCLVESNYFDIKGDGPHDYGVLVQNGKDIVVKGNTIASTGNTVRIGQSGQATIEQNDLNLQDVKNSNLYINSTKDIFVRNNKISDSGNGHPAPYNLVIYIGGGNVTLDNNTIETKARGTKYNVIWADPGRNVKTVIIENNKLKGISVMGHVLDMIIEYNTFEDIRGHLFTNSVNVIGKTKRVVVADNTVDWVDGGEIGYLLYLVGNTDTFFDEEKDVIVSNNTVNVNRSDLVRYNLNQGKLNSIKKQTISR